MVTQKGSRGVSPGFIRENEGLGEGRAQASEVRLREPSFHLRKELAPRRGAGVWADRAKNQDWTEIVRWAIVYVRGSGSKHWCPNQPWFGLRRTGCHVISEYPIGRPNLGEGR